MSSLLTNASAMTAVRVLSQTQANLTAYESQASTGLRVADASDNAAYWSIATKMNDQVSALGTVSDALAESEAMISVTSTALNSTISILQGMRNDLISASQPGADLSSVDTAIAAKQAELVSIGTSATFNGQNWLAYDNATPTSGPDTTGEEDFPDGTTLYSTPPPPFPHPDRDVDLVSGYDPQDGVSTISINTNNLQLFESASWGVYPDQGILGFSSITVSSTQDIRDGVETGPGPSYLVSVLNMKITSATQDDINQMLKGVESAIDLVTTSASQLGATLTQVQGQQNFVAGLTDSLKTGVSALVDADMDSVSTRISALQVQMQLGITSLNIANSNDEMILELFQS